MADVKIVYPNSSSVSNLCVSIISNGYYLGAKAPICVSNTVSIINKQLFISKLKSWYKKRENSLYSCLVLDQSSAS